MCHLKIYLSWQFGTEYKCTTSVKKRLSARYSTTIGCLVVNLKKNSNWRDISVCLLFGLFLCGALSSKSASVPCIFLSFRPVERDKREKPGIPLNLNCVKFQTCIAIDKKPFLTVSVIIIWKSGGDNEKYSTKLCWDSTFFRVLWYASLVLQKFLVLCYGNG